MTLKVNYNDYNGNNLWARGSNRLRAVRGMAAAERKHWYWLVQIVDADNYVIASFRVRGLSKLNADDFRAWGKRNGFAPEQIEG